MTDKYDKLSIEMNNNYIVNCEYKSIIENQTNDISY